MRLALETAHMTKVKKVLFSVDAGSAEIMPHFGGFEPNYLVTNHSLN